VGRWAGEEGASSCWAGPRGEENREKRKTGWAGPCRKKERKGKKKERVGRAQREKEGEKEMHFNAFEFKFKI
jgi:hypothetical protein